MKKGVFKTSVALVLLTASLSLTGCGGRLSTTVPAMPQQTPFPQDTYNPPADNIDYGGDAGYGYDDKTPYGGGSMPTGTPNAQVGKFKVDQDLLNQWQAKGIAVTGGTIYVSAADSSNLFKKGTVVKMSSSNGKEWKDLGGKWLGTRHPIDSTVQGLAVLGGSIIAVDSKSQAYSIEASSGKVKVIKSSGGLDVASGGGSVYISNGAVMKSDMNASAGMPLNGMVATGGIGADNLGNVYSVSGNVIKKSDSNGQVMDVVTTDLTAPMDVAVDSRNGDIYVLETSMIKRFTTNGQFIVSFSNGASKPAGIAIDETGAVYVADTGSSHKDSYVLKFAPADLNSTGYGMDSMMNNGYGSASAYGSYDQGAYSGYGTSTGSNAYGTYNNNYGTSNTGAYNTYNNAQRGY